MGFAVWWFRSEQIVSVVRLTISSTLLAWTTFDDLFAPRYDRVAGFGKPVMVAEFGSTRVGAEQVEWFDDAFASTPDYPLVRTVVFFQAPDTQGVWGAGVATPTWRIDPATLPNGGP